MFRTNLDALHRYRPGEYAGALTLLAAADGGIRYARGAGLGLVSVGEGGVQVTQVPGDHYQLLTSPRVRAVEDAVRALLAAQSNKMGATLSTERTSAA